MTKHALFDTNTVALKFKWYFMHRQFDHKCLFRWLRNSLKCYLFIVTFKLVVTEFLPILRKDHWHVNLVKWNFITKSKSPKFSPTDNCSWDDFKCLQFIFNLQIVIQTDFTSSYTFVYRINWEIYTMYITVVGILIHRNSKFKVGKLKWHLLR